MLEKLLREKDYDVIKAVSKYDFPTEFGTFEGDADGDIEEFAQYMYQGFGRASAHGASKEVVILSSSLVLKVPFTGEWRESYNKEKDAYEDKFYHFDCDYCRKELEIYKLAKKAGIDMFFAMVEEIEPSCYLMEYVTSIAEDDSRIPYCELSNEVKSRYLSKVPSCRLLNDCPEWIALATAEYGEEKVMDLLTFVDKYKLNDFHSGNIGCREDGSPCILDYSGFYGTISC